MEKNNAECQKQRQNKMFQSSDISGGRQKAGEFATDAARCHRKDKVRQE